MVQAPQRQKGDQPNRRVGMFRQRHQFFRRGSGRAEQAHHRGVAQVGVGVVVLLDQLDQRPEGGRVFEFPKGDRGMEPHANRCVAEQRDDRPGPRFVEGLADHLGGLGADLGGLVLEQRQQRRHGPSLPAPELSEAPDPVQAGQNRTGLFRRGEQGGRAFGAAPGQLKLRVAPDAQVRMLEQIGQLRNRALFEAGLENRPGLRACFVGRGVEFPDAALVGRAVHPIADVQSAVRAEVDAGVEDAAVNRVFAGHFERRAFGRDLKRAEFLALGVEEVAAVFFSQGGAGVVGEAARAVGVVGHRRYDPGGLAGKARLEEFLFHPDVVRLFTADLPVEAPAGHAAFDDVEEAFPFAGVIAVVVDTEKVGVFVEGQFLGVADAVVEHFKPASVRFAAHHRAAVGQDHASAVGAGGVDALVAHRPVDPPIHPDRQARHVVTALADVNRVAGADARRFVHDPVAVGIVVAPDVRLDGAVGRSVGEQGAGGDAGDRAGHGMHHHLLVRLAVTVRVDDAVDLLLLHRQIAPVTLPVAVAVRRPVGLDRGVHAGADRFFVEIEPVLEAPDRQIVLDPGAMLSQVEAGDLTPPDARHVRAALRVHADAHR